MNSRVVKIVRCVVLSALLCVAAQAQTTKAAAKPAKLGDGRKTVYLDIGKSFLDADGQIPKDIMPDGLHPNEKGYDLWYEAMRPTLEQLLGK